ncbi:MAG: hypothetical protein A3F78_01155 [Burkholderiales bacterium RIFCSPLOWO2_12_FULL_61_40]|nr:MAG: hypothetical protein A3F78_01155 [Burkholderiales bacterium RIFCSPLOWO2_12_FULL_61_40]
MVCFEQAAFSSPEYPYIGHAARTLPEGAPMMERAMEHTVKCPGAGTRPANTPRFIGILKGLGAFRATINRTSPICADRSARA